MATRRLAREWAVQMLTQFDLNPPESLPVAVAQFWDQQKVLEQEDVADGEKRVTPVFTAIDPRNVESLERMQTFAADRVFGVMQERENLDAALTPFLSNWEMYRLGTVERAVLRLAAWELLHKKDIPAPIVVNEAVDIAKWFSETKSGRFVNAVLDGFSKDLAKKSGEGTFTP